MSWFSSAVPTPAAATLLVTPEYGWNILVASTIAFHVLGTGFSVASVRKKYGIPYPDMGNGRHAQKLTDAQWTEFNNYQRAHYNYVEGVASAITLQLLGGLFFPKVNAALGVAYIVGRFFYALGYQKKGPPGRYYGALALDVALLGMFLTSVFGALRFIGYFN